MVLNVSPSLIVSISITGDGRGSSLSPPLILLSTPSNGEVEPFLAARSGTAQSPWGL